MYRLKQIIYLRVKGKDEPVGIFEPIDLLENVSKAESQLLKRFHIGIKQFRAQNWDAAEREIFSLSQLEPERKIYQIYLDRIMYFREHPPEEIWDGSFTHTSK